MAIKVKNSQLNNDAIDSLNTLINTDINASIAFKLTRILKELSSIIDDKVKMEKRIFDKWVKRDDNGNPLQYIDENGEFVENTYQISDNDSFTKEMAKLMEVENEIPYEAINFEDLEIKTAKVSDLMKLEFLFN